MIYISDLDGTLLNDKAVLSSYTINTIKQLNNKGIKFTIATARSLYSAIDFIEQLDLQYPCVLRNGTVIYDPVKKKIIKEYTLTYDVAKDIISDLISFGTNPIVHRRYKGNETVEYTGVYNEGEKQYFNARLLNADNRFNKVSSYDYKDDSSFVSISIIEKDHNCCIDQLKKKYEQLCKIHHYQDSYSKYYWLEFTHKEVSKKIGCQFIINYLNEDIYIAFGDAYNDLSMLENAGKGLIPIFSQLHREGEIYDLLATNNDDGVAKYLAMQHGTVI